MADHVLPVAKQPGRLPASNIRQGKDLEKPAVKGDKVLGDQSVPGENVLIE